MSFVQAGFKLVLAIFLFAGAVSQADEFPQPVNAQMVMEDLSIQPGRSFWIGIYFDVEQGWHTYWQHPGDAGMPLTIQWDLPQGWKIEEVKWPHPVKFVVQNITGYGYEKPVLLMAKVIPPTNATVNEEFIFEADARWVACSGDTCLPGSQHLQKAVRLLADPPHQDAQWTSLFENVRATHPSELLEARAVYKNELVELQVKLPYHLDPGMEVYYCGLDDTSIDPSFAPTLIPGNKQGDHTVILKHHGTTPHLNGVLVFHNEKQSIAYALSHVPIDGIDGEHLTAMASTTPYLSQEAAIVYPDEVGGFGWALILAFAGGLLLNLMPCVLPVISFKVLGFVKMAGENRWEIFKQGAAFSLGVLVSFWILASVLLLLQAYGEAVGWGFQLQEPLFVALLAAIIFVFGLSLFGVFEIGTSVTNWAGGMQGASSSRHPLVGSFFSGVLATAVATPCTGPFLGPAVGFAVTLPFVQALTVFTSLGLGMSAPYLLLAACPSLLKLMPKPGNWMLVFKELMGFLMIATVLWLLWVFGAQTSTNGVMLLLGSLAVMAFGCWIYGTWGTPVKSKQTRFIATAMTAVVMVCGAYGIYLAARLPSLDTPMNQVADGEWEVFSPQRVEELRQQGVPVLIDFTARWCLICQANHLVLVSPEVDAKLRERGVVKMKADWTKHDPVITAELKKFGRNSVPLYIFYSGKDGQPEILPQVLTQETVLEKLRDSEQAAR